MTKNLKKALNSQFGASIEMLKNAINLCPTAFWDTEKQFWYQAYHCLFFLDYYLTLPPVGFTPPAPFDLSEFEDRPPSSTYSKVELLTYLEFCKNKCTKFIGSITNENIIWQNESKTMEYSVFEILLYNMRHVQHHVAQLNMLLRQNINDAPEWVYEACGEV